MILLNRDQKLNRVECWSNGLLKCESHHSNTPLLLFGYNFLVTNIPITQLSNYLITLKADAPLAHYLKQTFRYLTNQNK